MDARRLPARHGVLWLLGGFQLFRRHPPLMTLLTFGYLMTVLVVNLIPKVGPFVLPLLLPALTTVLGNGCRAVERGRPFTGGALWDGLARQRVELAKLGGFHLLGSALLVTGGSLLGSPINVGDGMTPDEAIALVSEMAVVLLLASPMLMAFWFAPLLTGWDGVSAAKSLFFSLVASWRNWRCFAAYGIAVIVVGALAPGLILIVAGQISQSLVTVLGTALRLVLIFVLAPTLVASIYLSYRDVFAAPAAADE